MRNNALSYLMKKVNEYLKKWFSFCASDFNLIENLGGILEAFVL